MRIVPRTLQATAAASFAFLVAANRLGWSIRLTAAVAPMPMAARRVIPALASTLEKDWVFFMGLNHRETVAGGKQFGLFAGPRLLERAAVEYRSPSP